MCYGLNNLKSTQSIKTFLCLVNICIFFGAVVLENILLLAVLNQYLPIEKGLILFNTLDYFFLTFEFLTVVITWSSLSNILAGVQCIKGIIIYKCNMNKLELSSRANLKWIRRSFIENSGIFYFQISQFQQKFISDQPLLCEK